MGKTPVTVSQEELLRQQEYSQRIHQYYQEKLGRAPVACTDTYGCQQNESDSEILRGMMAQMGFTFTHEPEEADLVLFNTCAVREHAEMRVYGNVGALVHQKRRNPDLIVAVCGCMA